MEKIVLILEHFGELVGVIITSTEDVQKLVEKAIKDNIEFDDDTVLNVKIPSIGDFGDYTVISVEYVDGGSLCFDDEFCLIKTVIYS